MLVMTVFVMPLQAQNQKLKLAVYATGNVDALLKNIAQNNASTELVNGGRYQMIERSAEFLKYVSEEQNYQRSGAVDEGQIAELGKQYGAQFVCVVDITYYDKNKYLYVATRMIDVVAATSQRAGDAENTNYMSPADLRKCVTEAVKKMEGKSSGNDYSYANDNVERGELMIGNDKYVGDIKNGKPHGKGRITYAAGDHRKYYDGDWYEGKRHGQGTLVWNSGEKYVGDWYEGKMHGQGTLVWNHGDKYVGDFDNGKMQGQGTYYWNNGNKYVGDWYEDKRHGQGTYYWPDGDKYVGGYKNGKCHGHGTYYWSDGRSEKCYYIDGEKQ